MQHRRANSLILLVVVAVLAAACSSASPDDRPIVEVFGPYRAEEAAHFAASFAPFEEQTGIDVRYVGSGSFSRDIQNRAADANYPDVALFPQPSIIRDLAHQGLLVPLSDESVGTRMGSDADVRAGIVGDTAYAVWFRAVVKSLVWYQPDVFRDRGYEVPRSWQEMMSLTEQIEADGLTPWCLSMESFAASGWVGTDWIEDIVLRQHGPDVYDQWVQGSVTFEDEAIIEAFEVFGEIVHKPGRVLGGTHRILNEPWRNAQTPMFDIDPGCLMYRQASYQETNLPSSVVIGDTVDVFVLPAVDGGEPPILASGDLAAAFNDRPEVKDFLAYLATPEAGEAWAAEGGFTSPHPDFDPDSYATDFDRRMGEIIQRAEVVRFDGSDLMVSGVGTGTFWTGIQSYVRNGDARAAATEIQAGYPETTHLAEVPTSDG